MKKTSLLSIILMISLMFSCDEFRDLFDPERGEKKPEKPFKGISSQIVHDWNTVTYNVMAGTTYDPMIGSRVFAMVHLAMHDALNNISPVYEVYALKNADSKADPLTALASAAHGVLAGTFPAKKDMLDSALNSSTRLVPEGDAKSRGFALGQQAANQILELRKNDGAFQHPIAPINNPLEPGLYQGVPPTEFVYAPFWATLPPFGLETPSQFRVEPRPALNSSRYATDYNEVKAYGQITSTVRSADQTSFAKYWYEFSEIGWNRITSIAARDKKLDLAATTRIFALVNIALADSYIAGWDSKFHYNFWRPYTAIRAAETDGNPNTTPDTNWLPLMNTPPIHDYPSTHSALGNAAATVLSSILGNNVKFTMASPTGEQGKNVRTFTSFRKAAEENALSRVMAGIHFRFSCDAGLALGEDIGQWTLQNHLKPLKVQ